MVTFNRIKAIVLFGILSNCISGYGQSIEVYGGYGINQLFHFGIDGHYEIEYSANDGYSLGVGLENVQIDNLNMRFTLSLHHYKGNIKETYSGLANSSTTEVYFSKSDISLGLFPLNFYLFNHLNINAGFSISRLLSEDFHGIRSGCSGNPDGTIDSYRIEIDDENDRFSSKWSFALQTRLAYDIHLSENLALSPFYSYSFGFSAEFSELDTDVKLMRHLFGISIKIKLINST